MLCPPEIDNRYHVTGIKRIVPVAVYDGYNMVSGADNVHAFWMIMRKISYAVAFGACVGQTCPLESESGKKVRPHVILFHEVSEF